jgi:hypothetical protein
VMCRSVRVRQLKEKDCWRDNDDEFEVTTVLVSLHVSLCFEVTENVCLSVWLSEA